jgi:RNA polymerase sigma-70 factor (ECF subfamily)
MPAVSQVKLSSGESMGREDHERALWLSRNILPHEFALGRLITRWRLPVGLEAEDIIQEAYAKIASLPSVAGILSPRSYFFQVARSIFLMHIRRTKLVSIDAVADLEQLNSIDYSLSPEIEVSDREQLRHLAEAVAILPEPNRSALLLRVIHELSHNEIAHRLGMSANAVQKMLAKSLSLLADQIGRGGKEAGRASTALDQIHIRSIDDSRSDKT